MSAVDWTTEETLRRFDVAERLDVYFPGGMPKTRWEYDSQYETADYSTSYIRQKAAPVAYLYDDIACYPLLTQSQERGEDLDDEDKSNGQMNPHRWRLVLHDVRLVIHLALKFPHNVVELDDLVQEGIPGLITAARKFDTERGIRFSTYAWYWIRQSMFRTIQNNHNLIRWPVYKAEELVPANSDERAAFLPPGERYVKPFDGSELEATDAIDASDDETLEQLEIIQAIHDSIESCLSERQTRILRQRFGIGTMEEQTLEEVGQREGVTRERIRQIQQRSLQQLKWGLPEWMRREYEVSESEAEN